METLKVVTETNITSTSTGTPVAEEKYKVIAPESMHETFMSDSEDEGGEKFFYYSPRKLCENVKKKTSNWLDIIFVVWVIQFMYHLLAVKPTKVLI